MKQQKILTILAIIATICQIHAQTKNIEPPKVELPGRYFTLLESGIERVKKRMAEPNVTLASIETETGWKHFPNSILVPAVLYTKHHPANKRYGDTSLLQLAFAIGDMLVKENETGFYATRQDSDWDTYMWLEAYRLLENKLGETRRQRWRQVLLKNIGDLEPNLSKCQDYPQYNAPFITTSPNHYSIYASTLLVAGHVFNKPEWIRLSTKVLHRFCISEQTVDGYWGEHSPAGPTTGYDYLTVTQIALYREYSKDPEALKALRRSTSFHENYTYPDGTPVETINDRNRYWGVSMWGQFGFSNFADGRRYAAFLTGFSPYEGDTKSYGGDLQTLGRIAQNAVYYHEGKTSSIPQDMPDYRHSMNVPAGIRKTGAWVVTYSGIIAPPVTLNNFFLDRQGNWSVYNKKTGLIISGANSKRQPELATFTEVIGPDSIHMPVSTVLKMGGNPDSLSLSYNTFFAVLEAPKPMGQKLGFRFRTFYKWGDAVSQMNLQVVLKAGQTLETGTGQKIVLGSEKIELTSDQMGGLLRHNGWVLHLPPGMTLTWPVFPFNPYKDKPETELMLALGRLSTTLRPENQDFPFMLEVN